MQNIPPGPAGSIRLIYRSGSGIFYPQTDGLLSGRLFEIVR